ncbi:hypothetical protein M433DRAFT_318769 [Acidomyces richmondensis BFW]|nr:MAG: hypothetical protein FE78DRAFT_152337 [Acidomyces sp. 'richmondensis']KYG44167.1 hypothetical protein M433DRAFT_318769 [Acidomyces richmondensis BFW]
MSHHLTKSPTALPTSRQDGLETNPTLPCTGTAGNETLLDRATHILAAEAIALANITTLYRTNLTARQNLGDAIEVVIRSQRTGGKLIACGVGKSSYIAQKLVATCKSLGICASFLHACEALHGDLGDVRPKDVVVFVSFSGKTPELLDLLPHLPAKTEVLALTGHLEPSDCMLFTGRSKCILLPAVIPEKEEITVGVAAPSISTTVALAVADMLALTVANELYGSNTRKVFRTNHPGGAIGMNQDAVEQKMKESEKFTVLELPSPSISASDDG